MRCPCGWASAATDGWTRASSATTETPLVVTGAHSLCQLEASPAVDQCPPSAVTLAPGRQVYLGTTVGAGAHFTPSCGNGNSQSRVYQITPTATGTLQVDLQPLSDQAGNDVDLLLASRSTCSSTTDVSCVNTGGPREPERISAPATTGTPYVFIVSDVGSNGGSYQLAFTLQALCGNTYVYPADKCDDGNTAIGDGCESTFQYEPGCTASAMEPNGVINPDVPPKCASFGITGALSPASDQDFFAVPMSAGQTATIEFFTQASGLCLGGAHVVAEMYPSSLSATPTNHDCA